MRARRGHVLKVRLDDGERAELQRRALAHKTTLAGHVRSTLLPQSRPVSGADSWWDALPADRREQVHRWLTQRGHQPEGPIPGQLEMHPVEGDAEAV